MSYPAFELEIERIILLSPVACPISTILAENDLATALSPVALSTLTACAERVLTRMLALPAHSTCCADKELSNVIILRDKYSKLHKSLVDDGFP